VKDVTPIPRGALALRECFFWDESYLKAYRIMVAERASNINAVERTMRPIVPNRKNALVAGHDGSAENWACIASLIETC
jgi:hypothetical protein